MLRMELQNGETEELKEDFGQDILGQMEAQMRGNEKGIYGILTFARYFITIKKKIS